MKEYVVCFVTRLTLNQGRIVLLIEKAKPEWQKGQWNFPGGAVEEGETPVQAATRELGEEAGVQTLRARKVAQIVGGETNLIHIVECLVSVDQQIVQLTNERLAWFSVNDINHRADVIPNLKVIIPLLLGGCDGWTMFDSPPGSRNLQLQII